MDAAVVAVREPALTVELTATMHAPRWDVAITAAEPDEHQKRLNGTHILLAKAKLCIVHVGAKRDRCLFSHINDGVYRAQLSL